MPSDTDDSSFNWEEVIEVGIKFLGSPAAGTLISMLFNRNSNTETMITAAVEEICNRITKAIDVAFMNEYIADTNSIANRLSAFNDSKDKDILDELFADASDTVQRLKRFNTIEGILAFNYICTLHLIIIQALSEYNIGYKETLSRTGKEYSELSKSKSDIIVNLTRDSIDPINFEGLDHGGYTIETHTRGAFTEYATIKFDARFLDRWENSPHVITSDPFELTNPMMYYAEGFPSRLLLTPSAQRDTSIINKHSEFIIKAQKEWESYLDNKLVFPRRIESTILSACKKWESL
ncbi:hypothetical protein B0P06_005247 [Clostridium saccharoperbutylacetonicum]|uniref:Uncharacterized protein n=1 Tax=Clostridium saccharoperbutylacetonicum N1-4(HMT) TaxID=931276 RepID=M1MEY7_9CLOT|nr:hypothetical protein [Clostridium saccharoperbutylacetonicum]AGF56484.1 hypothetical protein Cspa_c27190 [Clostridium saccharoperbutylacetonicum N1-4(HMT)]NRT62769.1 hypothetical protein [Clostridium saccharoperbutylacetonicum]NSB26121.1 hypothetical protein [Clostridium saccharoperbutylacetonicum]NSB45476.1 hypothetical protein [Clostridium saccharoperbutylacetonicum]